MATSGDTGSAVAQGFSSFLGNKTEMFYMKVISYHNTLQLYSGFEA